MKYPENSRAGDGEDGGVDFLLAMDPGLLAFQGHFPGNPLVPGVVQVDWAIHFGTAAFGPLGSFLGVDQLKFMDTIRPGDELRLRLTLDPDRTALRFAFRGPAGKKSSGIVRFTGKGDA